MNGQHGRRPADRGGGSGRADVRTSISANQVITETLVRATAVRDPHTDALTRAVDARGGAEAVDPALDAGYDALAVDPLASWIEDTFGVIEEQDSGRLVRRRPTKPSARCAVGSASATRPRHDPA